MNAAAQQGVIVLIYTDRERPRSLYKARIKRDGSGAALCRFIYIVVVCALLKREAEMNYGPRVCMKRRARNSQAAAFALLGANGS
jgi:hypothetical protein